MIITDECSLNQLHEISLHKFFLAHLFYLMHFLRVDMPRSKLFWHFYKSFLNAPFLPDVLKRKKNPSEIEPGSAAFFLCAPYLFVVPSFEAKRDPPVFTTTGSAFSAPGPHGLVRPPDHLMCPSLLISHSSYNRVTVWLGNDVHLIFILIMPDPFFHMHLF